MSFLDNLNKLANPFKEFLLKSPIHSLLSDSSAVVSFTNQQSGEKVSTAADYIRYEDVVYLIFEVDNTHWKNLENGAPVDLLLGGIQTRGWAEDLTGYEEFFKILSKNPAKQTQLIQRYDLLKEEKDLYNLNNLQDFLNENKIIRVKISRKA
jgi:hypothetical protein